MTRTIKTIASSAFQAVSVLAVLMIVLVWIGVGHNLSVRRDSAKAATIQNISNLSRVFEEHVARSLKEVDKTLLFLRVAYENDPDKFDLSKWVSNSEFRSDINVQFALIAADGFMISSNVGPAGARVDLSDREHFRVHVGKAEDELFVSKPVLGRVSKKWTVQLTRKIRNADGSFGGVVVGSIDPYHFSRFYESIDIGKGGAVTLIGFDGIVRARGGVGDDALGRSAKNSEVMTVYKHSPQGILNGSGNIDGVRRLLAYRVVDGYPLLVVVGMAEDEIYAEYNRSRVSYFVLGTCLTALMIGLVLLGMLQKLRLESTMVALAAERDNAEAANKAKSTFLAMMSHEIRTPMNAILGLSNALLERPLEQQDRELVGTIYSEGDNLLGILNDILDYSKLEAGKLTFESILFSPGDIVDGVMRIVEPRAQAKGLRLECVLDPSLPKCLEADAGRIRQVLLNLVSNAVKFTPAGSVSMVTRCVATDASIATVEWSVTDTGIGIAKERLGSLFGDFVQADASINRRFGGSGLGLAICRRIVQQMGGEITVDSELGRGTTVSFRIPLPVAQAELKPEADPEEPNRQLRAHIARLQRPLRLLIVDDNRTNRLVAAKMLSGFDVQIAMAGDGTEAVAAASKFAYDVILMDMRMPEMDGLEATRTIRAAGGLEARVPIIAFTANAFPDDIRACSEAGMDDLVVKPVRRSDLLEVLGRVLGRTIGSRIRPSVAATADAGSMPAPAAVAVVEVPDCDRARLEDLLNEIGPEARDDAIASLLQELQARISALTKAVPGTDVQAITREAHSIKGLAGTFGLMALAEQASWLERNAESVDAPHFATCLERLHAGYQRATVILEKPSAIAA